MSICRSVLAEAVFKELVNMSPLKSFVSVDSASIGPAVGKGSHDPRVMWAAQKAGLNLSRRNICPFDEQVDIVNHDLVLTMDHFDHDEVRSIRYTTYPATKPMCILTVLSIWHPVGSHGSTQT